MRWGRDGSKGLDESTQLSVKKPFCMQLKIELKIHAVYCALTRRYGGNTISFLPFFSHANREFPLFWNSNMAAAQTLFNNLLRCYCLVPMRRCISSVRSAWWLARETQSACKRPITPRATRLNREGRLGPRQTLSNLQVHRSCFDSVQTIINLKN